MSSPGPIRKQPRRPSIKDPLAVIPVRPETVDIKHDSRGMIHLRLRAEPKGLAKRIADWLGYNYTRKIELDEYGTLYYSQVDGKTPLKSIISRMANKLGKSRKETEGMVVLFTKKLMVMNMIALKVPESAVARRSDE